MAKEGPNPPDNPATPVRPGVGAAGGPVPAEPATSLVHLESTVGLEALELPDRGDQQHWDPPETLPPQSLFQDFVHGSGCRRRSQVYAAMLRTAQTKARCWAFVGCGMNATVEKREGPTCGEGIGGGSGVPQPAEFRVRGSCCHDRFCPRCANARAAEIRLALNDLCRKGTIRFVTLTLASKPTDSLRKQLDLLKTSFRYLRASKVWEDNVKGGAAFLEITRGEKGDRWHVHYHLLCDTAWLPQGDLSRTWLAITRTSHRADVRPVKDGNAINYITKYATKAVKTELLDTPHILDETMLALKGERLCFCFGDWYGTPLTTELEEDSLFEADAWAAGWRSIGSVNNLLRESRRGNAAAALALASTDFGRWLISRSQSPPP